MRALFHGGPVRGAQPGARWVLVEDGSIASVGTRADDLPGADRVTDLAGATLIPAFCDAHVHLPATGLYAAGLNFRGEGSAGAVLAAFAARASQGAGPLFGGNFEDPLDRPLTGADLDAAVGDRPALLARADMHSAIVSSALLRNLHVTGLEGVDVDDDGSPTGYLREEAAAEAWRWFEGHLPRREQQEAVGRAVDLAYSKGVARVHEMFVVEWRSWASLAIVQEALQARALGVRTYVASVDVARVRALGFDRVGGDLFLDGSFGSHSAWLVDPYASPPPKGSPPNGISYRGDDDLVDFFATAQAAGMQTGVHAIGDAAIEQALRCWTRVVSRVGSESVRALGHRIEHFECSSRQQMARAARLGLLVSVQPAFDAYWGGESGLYSSRIGWSRAREMNRFLSMRDAGLIVGAGSDSTVTPLDPFLQMAALRDHHLPEERVDANLALQMHTLGSNALAGDDSISGSIEVGKRADLAIVDRDPIEIDPDELLKCEVLGTWIEGTRVWPLDEAEAR